MKARIIFVLIVMITSIMLTSCVDLSLPVYEKTDEDGVSVYIDGVRYKQLPLLKWEVHPASYENPARKTNIGYAGGWDIILSEALGDTEKNFILMKGTIADYYDGYLYRADKVIPEPSAESIDELMWVETYIDDEEDYSNIIIDKDIIIELFSVLDTGEKTDEYNMIEKNSKKVNMYISCKSNNLPGSQYILHIGTNNGKIICGDFIDKQYVEIPIDLLEKIRGNKLEGILY